MTNEILIGLNAMNTNIMNIGLTIIFILAMIFGAIVMKGK